MMPDYTYIFESFCKGRLSPFYNELYPALLRYAVKISGENLSYLAEDCVQSAILETYLHRESFESTLHWRNCLLRNIRNRVIDLIRKADCNKAYINNLLLSDQVEDDISLAIIYQDALDVIYAAVESLPEEYRKTFELSFIQGLKNAEIANLLCVAEITIKKRKARLLDKIRTMLGSDIDEHTLLIIIASDISRHAVG
ncbi:sigma-70 family RNA polymerase sigma factor [uncultured Duncaniella sp.]|uniref:RNA polymerase sigma factor n=1 Tax=uncultured Duncaniella sp. TaxID=2768039 RepID=UPI0025D71B0E|nr:sigma-70 family RNA polymerase sigma factor [uncultured Duncaniella sp.]